MSAEVLEVEYGEQVLEFVLHRRPRKTLSISVQPNLSIEVTAPTDATIDRICEKVRKKGPWITRQLRFFEQYQPRTPERRYVSGETHLYLGRQYKLKVIADVQSGVKLLRGQLVVRTHRPNRPDVTEALLQDWFDERAKAKFAERITICRGRFPDPEAFRPDGVIVRTLEQRWGSMTPKGNLVLNKALIHASTEAIDYVITHELCHIEQPHHGRAFFDLLRRVMPDWEKRKQKLERQLA